MNGNDMIKINFAFVILFWSSIVVAQDEKNLPALGTITVPDLSRSNTPEVVKNGWKFFFFHKSGVSFADAHADFTDCYRFLAPSGYADVTDSSFVPWRQESVRKDRVVSNGYTPVGGVIMKVFNIESSLARGDRQAKMRRCMEPRDYKRYGVFKDIWENVAAMEEVEAISIQAKIASEPVFNGVEPIK